MSDDTIVYLFALVPISIPSMAILFGLVLYWIARHRSAGSSFPPSEMHSVDDLFHTLLMFSLGLYGLLARRVVFGGGAWFLLVAVFLGVRRWRNRRILAWPLVVVAMTMGALAWRISHPLIQPVPMCTKLINNVG